MGLTVENICFGYGKSQVLHNVSVEFADKQLTGIVGPNGCGKSTLLQLLSNLLKPSSGRVLLDKICVSQYPRRKLAQKIAFLPQHPFCPPGITVGQVLNYGRHPYQSLLKQFSKADAEIIGQVKDLLQLDRMMDVPMEHLSGGQRQKAWLGMILTQDTDTILLDEPTSALDIGHQNDVMECIRAAVDHGKTLVMVIHDLGVAGRFCDQLLALKGGHVAYHDRPQKVLNRSLIRTLYGIDVDILAAPDDGSPIIVPHRLNKPRSVVGGIPDAKD